jgi:hypothetical protein
MRPVSVSDKFLRATVLKIIAPSTRHPPMSGQKPGLSPVPMKVQIGLQMGSSSV